MGAQGRGLHIFGADLAVLVFQIPRGAGVLDQNDSMGNSFLCRDLARSFCGRRMAQDRGHFAHEGPGRRLGNADEPALSGHRRLLRRNHPSLGECMSTGSGSVASSGHASSGTSGTLRPCARSCRLTREATGKAGAEDDSAEAACRRACTRCAGVSCR